MPDPLSSRGNWLVFARRLAYFTVVYNLVEGFVSMAFGLADDSLALFGFGADSFIEVGSALIVLWKLREDTGCASTRLRRERRAVLGISSLFVLLALGTLLGSGLQLASHRHPETSLPGLLVSSLSLLFMFALWKAKLRAARALDSSTLAGDAACSLACIQLSCVLFAGSLAYRLMPSLWWADALAAMALSLLIAREGIAGIRAASNPNFSGGCGCH